MPISSKSLFHYTSNGFAGLTSILQNGFKVSLCTETKTSDLSNGKKLIEKLAVPMLCFCDIPLSVISNHSKTYSSEMEGVYAIGMKKEWGIKHGLNPVIYIPDESNIAWHIQRLPLLYENIWATRQLSEDLIANNHLLAVGKDSQLDFSTLITVMEAGDLLVKHLSFESHRMVDQYIEMTPIPYITLFYKPYIDTYFRGGSTMPDYNFYNEREWRYIPRDLRPIHVFFEPDPKIEQAAKRDGKEAEELYSLS